MNFSYEQNRIFLLDENGKLIAEVTFPETSENIVDINHTFVDVSLRGQGIAAKLMKEAYHEIKKQNKKAILTCEYAIKWFAKNTEYNDILFV